MSEKKYVMNRNVSHKVPGAPGVIELKKGEPCPPDFVKLMQGSGYVDEVAGEPAAPSKEPKKGPALVPPVASGEPASEEGEAGEGEDESDEDEELEEPSDASDEASGAGEVPAAPKKKKRKAS